MSQRNAHRPKPSAAAALAAVLLACIALAACGGSSSSTTGTSTQAAATSPGSTGSSTTPGPGAPGARFGALRECLKKNGITLPKRKPGQGGRAGGLLGAGGGPQLPAGVSRAQFEAALKKCGGGQFGRGGRLQNNPARVAALTRFAACMRSNGVNLPPPNTSGNGPIFSTKGLATSSSQFRQAEVKCASELKGAFSRRGGAAGAAPPGGGPGG